VIFDYDKKYMSVHLKKSKTDYTSDGVTIFIGCSGNVVCGYCAMSDYLNEVEPCGDPESYPLFVTAVGRALRKDYFVSVVCLALGLAGFNPANFSGHSFRAGAATTAGDLGFEDYELKMLGRWSSSAYTVYLRNPKIVSTFAKRLVPT
jgi:hypothetical protein